MVEIVEEEDITDGKRRIYRRILRVPKNEMFPDGLKVTFNYMVFRDNEWLNIVRIDNHRHDPKRVGLHIHTFGKKDVEYQNLELDEIYSLLMQLGKEVEEKLRFKGE